MPTGYEPVEVLLLQPAMYVDETGRNYTPFLPKSNDLYYSDRTQYVGVAQLVRA